MNMTMHKSQKFALVKYIHFLGREYGVRVEPSRLLRKNGFCELADDVLSVHIPADLTPAKANVAAAQVLKNWYLQQAAGIFTERVKLYAAQIGVHVKSIKLADPKTRWGSCGRDGRLMFSWRTVMLPLALVDYLVVHELCHLVHFNHSKAYWQTVAKFLPDYKARRAELRAAERSVKTAV